MDLLRAGFSLFWVFLTLIFSGFVFWRKLRLERIDFEDMVIDRALIASVLGVIAGRLIYILLHLNTFGWDMGKWLSLGSMPGIVDIISLLVGLLSFWLLLGKEWKDPVEIMDYIAIAAAFFLFLVSVGDILLQLLGLLMLGIQGTQVGLPVFQNGLIIASVSFVLFYLLLFLFLSRIERSYRTFLWYRAKRRSAQTGFVLASFFMGYGLVGATLGWLLTPSIVIAGLGVDPILKLLVGLGGIVLLYVRSGRRLN